MLDIWHTVNSKTVKLVNIEPPSLKIDDIYIVEYKNEKYRAKLIHFLHGSREKYRVKYFLYNFFFLYVYDYTITFSFTVFID